MGMSTEKMRTSFRLLMLIATPKLTDKALLLFEKGKLPMQLQAYAHGTASREMMDMLGLDSGEKSLLLTMMPKADADDLLIRLRRELRLGLSGSGIAFTVPISGANKRVLQMVQQVCQEKPKPEMRRALMQENDYQIIVALVNQGYSEEVMAAARPAGAAGGTVLHSRRVGAEEALEDAFAVLWVDAASGVDHRQKAFLPLGSRRHHDLVPGRRVLHGVVQHDGQKLA